MPLYTAQDYLEALTPGVMDIFVEPATVLQWGGEAAGGEVLVLVKIGAYIRRSLQIFRPPGKMDPLWSLGYSCLEPRHSLAGNLPQFRPRRRK